MEVKLIKVLFIVAVFVFVDITVADISIPSFLKVGDHYTFVLPGDQGDVEIIEIDKSSGWVRVKSERSILSNAWVNIHSVVSIIPISKDKTKKKKKRASDIFN